MSDDNVRPFPVRKRPTPDEAVSQERRAREENHAQEERARVERKRQLSNTLEKNQWLRGRADRITVAQALNDLLVRIEKENGIRAARILEAAGLDNKNKRDYAIPRRLSPEQEKRLDERLKKGTEPYKKIVVAAAAKLKEAGVHVDVRDFLFEVFGQANFRSTPTQESDDGFEELASRLRFVAEAISAKYDLSKFFRDVERAGVSPAPTSECVQRDAEKRDLVGEEVAIEYYSQGEIGDPGFSLGSPIELDQFTWPGCCENSDGHLPVYPAIVLGAWQLGSPFPIPIVCPVSEAKTPVSAQGSPAVVLRLCIAPIGKQRSATPVLRVDLWAYIEVKVGAGWTKDWADDWLELRPGKVTVGNHEVSIESVPRLPSPFAPRHVEQHASMVGIPPDNILFLPINAAVCEDWFSFPTFRSLYNTRRSSLNDRALGYSLCEDFQEVLFSEFGCVTLADCVDDALCNPTAGLDRLLEQQVKRLQDAFEAARKAARDLRNQNWEVVKKRWETDENS